jgi:hypothetical protein
MDVFYFGRRKGETILYREWYESRRELESAARDAEDLFGVVRVMGRRARASSFREVFVWPVSGSIAF